MSNTKTSSAALPVANTQPATASSVREQVVLLCHNLKITDAADVEHVVAAFEDAANPTAEAADVATAIQDLRITSKRMFISAMKGVLDDQRAGKPLKPNLAKLSFGLLALLLDLLAPAQKLEPIIRDAADKRESEIIKHILIELKEFSSPSNASTVDSSILDRRKLHDGLSRVMKDSKKVLCIDEIQAAPELMEGLISWYHHSFITGKVKGWLVLSGTPPVGDGPPLQLEAHAGGKVVPMFCPTMSIIEVRALLTKAFGVAPSIGDLLVLWSLFDGVPGMYSDAAKGITIPTFNASAPSAVPTTTSTTATATLIITSASASASVSATSTDKAVGGADIKSPPLSLLPIGADADDGQSTATCDLIPPIKSSSSFNLDFDYFTTILRRELSLTDSSLTKSEVLALRNIPRTGKEISYKTPDYDTIVGLERRGCVKFVENAHSKPTGKHTVADDSKYVLIKDRVFAAALHLARSPSAKLDGDTLTDICGIGLEDAFRSVVAYRQTLQLPPFHDIGTKPPLSPTQFDALDFYYKDNDVDGVFHSHDKSTLVIVTAKLDPSEHMRYADKSKAAAQKLTDDQKKGLRPCAYNFITNNVTGVLKRGFGNRLKRIVIVATAPSFDAAMQNQLSTWYTNAHAALLNDLKGSEKAILLKNIEFGAVSLESLINHTSNQVEVSNHITFDRVLESRWPLLKRSNLVNDFNRMSCVVTASPIRLFRGRRKVGKTTLCQLLFSGKTDHFYVNLNDFAAHNNSPPATSAPPTSAPRSHSPAVARSTFASPSTPSNAAINSSKFATK